MGIQKTRFRGNVKIRGRPKEQARAEIMIMRQKEAYEERKRKRRFFALLDIIALISLVVSIYLFYQGKILNGILTLLVGVLIVVYFILRRILKQRRR
ncbi:MAG: hypothetical protein PHH54_06745 [Candidatus Nanoarchaeia archaeon]|nr:hypothetical protein [Candidatus Nanoarchaeia archaeon]MDD5741653.1 hypothetical protein [Candidatus Nanoarchaeia archaeon]